MQVLVLNCGSSSVKYELIETSTRTSLIAGSIEGIGGEKPARHKQRRGASADVDVQDHRGALALAMAALREDGLRLEGLYAVGHRVVHGGLRFRAPALIDEPVLEAIRETIALAPLHNPPSLLGIEVTREALQGVPQVAVFDTAFHHTLPPRAYRYAIAERLYKQYGVRRYGFHGTSHAFVARRAAELLGRPLTSLKLVTLHLGAGASAAAIDGGESIDTSMGLTPLEGLVMANRCGDLDPAATLFLQRTAGLDTETLRQMLDQSSGLRGLCGTSDMHEVLERTAAGDETAKLALDVYCYRVRKYVGAYAAALGRLDALVFTAGVGENAAEVRARSCEGLDVLGLHLDDSRNRAGEGDREIQAMRSAVKVLVIHTEEGLEIARLTAETVAAGAPPEGV